MSKVFGSFAELVESNKGLFERAKKNNQMGMCEAIWNSRSFEVSQLKSQIEKILSGQKMMKSETTLIQEDMKMAKKKVEELENLLCQSQRDKGQLDLELTNLRTQIQQIESEREKEALVVQTAQSEKEFFEAQIKKLESELKLEKAQKEELLVENKELASELDETTLNLKEQVVKTRSLTETCAQLETEKAKVIKAYKIMKEQAQELSQVKESHELLIEGLEKTNRSLESERDTLKKALAESRSEVTNFVEAFEQFRTHIDKNNGPKSLQKRTTEVTQ